MNFVWVWFLFIIFEIVKEIDVLGVIILIEGGYFSIVFLVLLMFGCNVGCIVSKDVMFMFCCRLYVYYIDGFYCFYNVLDIYGICGFLSYLF